MEPIEAEAMRWLAGTLSWERALVQLRNSDVRAPAARAVATEPGPVAEVRRTSSYPLPAGLEVATG